MKPSISILGGGWLGAPLANKLKKLRHSVKVATRSQQRTEMLSQKELASFQIDTDAQSGDLNAFLASDILIINIPNKNLAGFEWLAQQIAESAISKILFISSTSVYKPQPLPITEHCQAEDNEHPLVKIERLLQAIPAVETSILRFAGLIGPKRHPGNFFKHGRPVADPDAPVNLIHLDDCIGIIQAIIQQQAWGEVFNGCASTHPSKREFYSAARASLGLPAPEFAENSSSLVKCVNNTKIKQKLGFEFKFDQLLDKKLFKACMLAPE